MANISFGQDIVSPGTVKPTRDFMAAQIKKKVSDLLHLLSEAINTDDYEKAVVYLSEAKRLHAEIINVVGTNHFKHDIIVKQTDLAEKKVNLEAMDKTLPEKDEAIIKTKNFIPLVVAAGILGFMVYA